MKLNSAQIKAIKNANAHLLNAGLPVYLIRYSTGTRHNPHPWVIVTNAGMDDEAIFSDHPTFKEALINTTQVEENWEIMRRNDDGTLTTEY